MADEESTSDAGAVSLREWPNCVAPMAALTVVLANWDMMENSGCVASVHRYSQYAALPAT